MSPLAALRSVVAAPEAGARAPRRVTAPPPPRPALPLDDPRAGPWEGKALAALTFAAVCFGLLEMYSASVFVAAAEGRSPHAYALGQLGGAAVGAVLAAVVSRIDYRHLRRLAWPMLAVVILLLLVVVMPGTEAIAPEVNGARRWLRLGVSVQPSEFAKVAVIVWTAALCVKKQDRLHSLSRGLAPFLLVWLAVVALVLAQPNLSAALLIALLGALVAFAGGARIGHFILLAVLAVPVLLHQIASESYRMNRIAAFLNPSGDTDGVSYQIYQSLIAIGSGGLGGVGFGEGRQKYGFLPEPHNDFLFSMIAEEWGLIGILFTVALFTGFLWVGYRIAGRAPDRFGQLLAVGMTNLIAVSAFLHMGVAMALLPTTGVSLPFMSWGRSALLTAFFAVGVLLAVHRASQRAPEVVA